MVLAEPMMTDFTDAYMRQWSGLSLVQLMVCWRHANTCTNPDLVLIGILEQ